MIPHGVPTGRYRSRHEAALAADLEARGVRFTYEELVLDYSIPQEYTPDFQLANGVIIEFKGWFTSADRSKMLAVKRWHPELDIRMVFCNSATKLGKGSKTTYGQWCTKHGIPYADKLVPEAWCQ